jgi:hypothetical protein
VEDEGDAPETINLSDSQGVQAGTGNVQYNAWAPKASFDPASLSGLSPHAVLMRLEGMTHDEVVDLFARATTGDAAEVLKAPLVQLWR